MFFGFCEVLAEFFRDFYVVYVVFYIFIWFGFYFFFCGLSLVFFCVVMRMLFRFFRMWIIVFGVLGCWMMVIEGLRRFIFVSMRVLGKSCGREVLWGIEIRFYGFFIGVLVVVYLSYRLLIMLLVFCIYWMSRLRFSSFWWYCL